MDEDDIPTKTAQPTRRKARSAYAKSIGTLERRVKKRAQKFNLQINQQNRQRIKWQINQQNRQRIK